MFDEDTAAELSKQLHYTDNVKHIVHRFLTENVGLSTVLPDELTSDGNIIFSLGAVYEHRFVKLCIYFNKYWGDATREYGVRLICKHLWFAYLILFSKLHVAKAAFETQRPEHEVGLFTFIQNDFKTFCGIIKHETALDEDQFTEILGSPGFEPWS